MLTVEDRVDGELASPARQPLKTRLIGLLACVPPLIVVAGAVVARPVADDYEVESTFQAAGGITRAFSAWMHHWTSAYSMYAVLTVGPRIERTIGTTVYYPLVSLLSLALFVTATMLVVRGWARLTGWAAPTWWATALTVTALFGALVSFRHPSDPMLFGAFYWQAAWVPHLLPVMLIPPVAALLWTSQQRPGVAWVVLWAVVGVGLAGFAFAETLMIAVTAAVTWWVVSKLRDRRAARSLLPFVVALIAGLAGGFILVAKLPGTSARAVDYSNQKIGLARYDGLVAVARALVKITAQDAFHALASPAVLVGAVTGYAARRLIPSTDPSREAEAVGVIGTALLVATVGCWVAVSLGDLASYVAWWHLFYVDLLATLLAALIGWALAARGFAPFARRPRPIALGTPRATAALLTVIVWGAGITALAAHGQFVRRPVLDRNLAAAAAYRRHPTGSLTWRAAPVGNLVDITADPNFWITNDVATWQRIPVRALRVEEAAPVHVSIAWLLHH